MKLRIVQDEDPPNPRKEYDCFGKIVHWHGRYNFGERIEDVSSWLNNLAPTTLVLPLCLLDHSGLHLYIGTGAHDCDPGGWDSGPVGFIYATPEDIAKEFGGDKAKAEACLRDEVKQFDQYLQGNVWGFVIEDDEGTQLDSCWGFFGHEYAKQQGEEALRYAIEHGFDPVI